MKQFWMAKAAGKGQHRQKGEAKKLKEKRGNNCKKNEEMRGMV
jgi:hypothetical protein